MLIIDVLESGHSDFVVKGALSNSDVHDESLLRTQRFFEFSDRLNIFKSLTILRYAFREPAPIIFFMSARL